MRKWYIALLMLLALTACQQEPVLHEGGGENSFDPSKLSFNLTIEHPDGATKGVKKVWKNGDKVFLFFQGITTGYLTATLNGSSWATEYVGTNLASLGSTGTLHALYLPYVDDAPSCNAGQWTFPGNSQGLDTYYFYASAIPYTVSGSVLSAVVQMVKPAGYVQFFIPLAGASGTIQLACNALRPAGFASIAADTGAITEKPLGTAGTPIHGYPDTLEGEEGYYVSGKPVANPGTDYYFALQKANGTSYAHFYKNRTAIAANKAYELPAYTSWPAVGGDRCVLIANGRWKTVNEGASYPWSFGDPKTNTFVPENGEALPTEDDWTNLMNGEIATWKEIDIWGQRGYLVVSETTPTNYIFLPWSTSAISYYWMAGFTNAFQIADNGTYSLPNPAVIPGSGEAYVRALEKLNWFRIIAKGDGTISRQGTNAFEYSIDGGDWQTYSSPINVTAGQEIAFRSTVTTWNTNGGTNYRRIRPDFPFDVAGDITSLLVGDKYGTAQASVPASYSFSDFFKESLVEDASKLVLPMTSVPSNAFKSFFDSCPNLVAGPAELPATSVAATCYRNMFKDCSSLTSAPIIRRPTTHSGTGWYQQMFLNCSSLQEIVFLDDYAYASTNFDKWVSGVNASGTFYKSSSMTTFPAAAGVSSIPAGWSVQNYQE